MTHVAGVEHADGVDIVIGSMCMYGLVMPKADRTAMLPAKKPTNFMSKGSLILPELCVKRDKSHTHQPSMGGRADRTQANPYMLCHASCRD